MTTPPKPPTNLVRATFDQFGKIYQGVAKLLHKKYHIHPHFSPSQDCEVGVSLVPAKLIKLFEELTSDEFLALWKTTDRRSVPAIMTRVLVQISWDLETDCRSCRSEVIPWTFFAREGPDHGGPFKFEASILEFTKQIQRDWKAKDGFKRNRVGDIARAFFRTYLVEVKGLVSSADGTSLASKCNIVYGDPSDVAEWLVLHLELNPMETRPARVGVFMTIDTYMRFGNSGIHMPMSKLKEIFRALSLGGQRRLAEEIKEWIIVNQPNQAQAVRRIFKEINRPLVPSPRAHKPLDHPRTCDAVRGAIAFAPGAVPFPDPTGEQMRYLGIPESQASRAQGFFQGPGGPDSDVEPMEGHDN